MLKPYTILVTGTVGTPVRLSQVPVPVMRATFYGMKAKDRTPNANTVFFGQQDARVQQVTPFTQGEAGGEVVLETPGCPTDLYDQFLEIQTEGDGIVISVLL